MKQVYNILTAVEEHFKNNEENTNTVTFGDLDKVDLSKMTLFPLAHFNISDIRFKGSVIELFINIMCIDVVDEGSKYDGSFRGADNLQDVLNTQAMVLNKLIDSFRARKGYLAEQQFVLSNEPNAELVVDKENNLLNGWGTVIQVEVPNNISSCEYVAAQV